MRKKIEILISRLIGRNIEMNLHLQDPTNPGTPSLHEILIRSCISSETGGGAFAFVSSAGVQLFLEDESFIKFAEEGV